MINIKAELKSKLFIILIVVIAAMILGSIASVFIHFDFNDFNSKSDNQYDKYSSDSNNEYDDSYNSSYNNYSKSSYNSYSNQDSSNDENMTLEERIKNFINNL